MMKRIRATKKVLVRQMDTLQDHIDLLTKQATRERLVRAKLAIIAVRQRRTLQEVVTAG